MTVLFSYRSLIVVALLLAPAAGAWAQVGSVDADTPGGYLQNPAAPRYDVIALRVEFQPDSSRFSSGDGTFGGDLFPGLTPRIDPYPHDAAYFEAHLDFLESYVAHVSRGATVVRTHLVPEIVRVSGEMADYSPIGANADSPTERAKLAALVVEAWSIADATSSFQPPTGLNPSTTAFILFHAGTGRDIELTGTTLDRTPEDLPSLFFDENTLTDLTGGAIRFAGLQVTSTAVIPETESKRGVDPISGEPFLLELSINGLLAASFLNVLGVPDLFDTATGGSAIGPYGLMDPLGIFAYGGLLPPEPSGWTKQYLGWSAPQILDSAPGDQVRAELRAGVDVAIAPVSSTEYFLAEVRHRDTAGDDLNLVVYLDGERVNQTFTHDSEDFASFDQSGFEGVLVSADDYDWALPGGFDTSGELRLGGVLIWHVDDNRFRREIGSNSVNADPDRRALDLEEADSAQDLGHPSGNPFAPEFDRGTPFDFYFEGNPIVSITETGEVALYENRFGRATWPNSNTNGGGPSFVVLEDFSPVSTTMTAVFTREEDGSTRPVPSLNGVDLGSEFDDDGSVALIKLDRGPAALPGIFVHGGAGRSSWLVLLDGGVVTALENVVGKPAVTSTQGASKVVAYLQRDDTGETYLTVTPLGQSPPIRYPLPAEVRLAEPSTPLLVVRPSVEPEYFVGFDLGSSGAVVRLDVAGVSELIPTSGPVRALAGIGENQVAIVEDDRTRVLLGAEVTMEWRYAPVQHPIGQAVFGADESGDVSAVLPLIGTDRFLVLAADGESSEFTTWSGVASTSPVMADVDADGRLDIVYATGATIEAMSQAGAVVAGFPIQMADSVLGQVLVAQWEGDRLPSVIAGLRDGYLHAFSLADGRSRDGFPLAVGGGGVLTPAMADSAIYAISTNGTIGAWTISGLEEVVWGELYGRPENASFNVVARSDPPATGTGLIDEDETYNWPNPVIDGVTRIRVKTSERCEIRMTVVDMSGALMFDEVLGTSHAGVATEFEWRPDVASGVFFARIEAVAPSGESADKLIRVAVIR